MDALGPPVPPRHCCASRLKRSAELGGKPPPPTTISHPESGPEEDCKDGSSAAGLPVASTHSRAAAPSANGGSVGSDSGDIVAPEAPAPAADEASGCIGGGGAGISPPMPAEYTPPGGLYTGPRAGRAAGVSELPELPSITSPMTPRISTCSHE